MRLKPLLRFIFKKTPARLAFVMTLLYGLFAWSADFVDKNAALDAIYMIVLLPVLTITFKFGCGGGFFGGNNSNCISNDLLLLFIMFGTIFLLFWIILKIIFFLNTE